MPLSCQRVKIRSFSLGTWQKGCTSLDAFLNNTTLCFSTQPNSPAVSTCPPASLADESSRAVSLEESLNAKEVIISRLHEELLAGEQAMAAAEESHRAEVKRMHAVVAHKVTDWDAVGSSTGNG